SRTDYECKKREYEQTAIAIVMVGRRLGCRVHKGVDPVEQDGGERSRSSLFDETFASNPLEMADRETSKTIWSYLQRRSKKVRARRLPSSSCPANCRISARVRHPSMAPSNRSSKESTVQIRSVNLCARFI